MSNILEGLALILLKNHYPKWLILEVGGDRPGDILRNTKWLSRGPSWKENHSPEPLIHQHRH